MTSHVTYSFLSKARSSCSMVLGSKLPCEIRVQQIVSITLLPTHVFSRSPHGNKDVNDLENMTFIFNSGNPSTF
jgi:hypothetical protein